MNIITNVCRFDASFKVLETIEDMTFRVKSIKDGRHYRIEMTTVSEFSK